MSNLILNREFTIPADGWYQLAPLGEFPHAGADVVQVIDAEACLAMAARFAADAAVPNFAGLLIDFDHFSMQGGQRSEAAGWITALEARCQTIDDRLQTADQDGAAGGRRPTPEADPAAECSTRCGAGLWAQIRWSDVGEAAVMGGRYRFLSPVWSREDCVELGIDAAAGLPRLRPIRLLNAAVTNDPNLKGMRPLSNSSTDQRPSCAKASEGTPQTADRRPDGKPASAPAEARMGDGQGVENRHCYGDTDGRAEGGDLKPEFRTGEKTMKSVIEKLLNHLGLAADASEAVVLEKLGTLPALRRWVEQFRRAPGRRVHNGAD
jgi:phage I-like protein